MAIYRNQIELTFIMILKIIKKVLNNILDMILVCTDVASRGLDFYDVNNTILLDMPESFTEYTHRIGRTARMDNPGNSLIILFEKVYLINKGI
jgi:superfamily II DNA/RNA helicase